VPIGTYYDNQFPTGSVRQDLQGVIYRVTPTDRPLSTMIGDDKARGKYHTWMTDALTVRSHNAQVEGHDITVAAPNVPSVVGNWTHILEKTWRVSESHEAMDHAGFPSLVGRQMKLRLIELLTDLETALWQSTLATGTSGAASQIKGVIATLSTHKTTTASGTSVGLDEALFNDMFQWMWQDVSMIPTEVFVGATLKRRISGFTTGITRNEVAQGGMAHRTIDVYYGDFGRLQIHLCRDVPQAGKGLGAAGLALCAIQPDFFKKAWLRTIKSEELPKLADSYDGRCVCEVTLQTGHEAAGLIHQGLS
jgi:hypothetical protein